MIKRIIAFWNYTKEGFVVLGEMRDGLITSDEAGEQIDALRRKYGIKDRP
jgi:hypothetical protein